MIKFRKITKWTLGISAGVLLIAVVVPIAPVWYPATAGLQAAVRID